MDEARLIEKLKLIEALFAGATTPGERVAADAARLRILELFEKSAVRHLSAEDVYRLLMTDGLDVGLATVYRVLTQFESAGLVTRHHFEGGTAVFELDEGEHHDHIVCVDCGRVEEFTDDSIEDRQREIASRLGFEISDHSLTLHGHCVRENCPHRRKQP